MSNSQWNEDQAIGERAQREHANVVQAAPELLAALEEILGDWPYVICVCGREKPRFPESLRERAKKAVHMARTGKAE